MRTLKLKVPDKLRPWLINTVFCSHPKLHLCDRYCSRDFGGNLRESDMAPVSKSIAFWEYTWWDPQNFHLGVRCKLRAAPVCLSLPLLRERLELGECIDKELSPGKVCYSLGRSQVSTVLT